MNNLFPCSYFALLVRAALASSEMRVLRVIFQEDIKCSGYSFKSVPITDKQRWDRSHPYLQGCDRARDLCEALAEHCRSVGSDPRLSPLYEGLEFKASMEAILEKDQVVVCEHLTPAAIFYAAEKGNILRYGEWELTVGSGDWETDAYGQDEWCKPLILSKAGVEPTILAMPGEYKARARKAYSIIEGEKFPGDDGLGKDPLHPYERYSGLHDVPDRS